MAGKFYIGNTNIKKIYRGNTQIKKAFRGNTQIYSSGYVVTYHIDTSNIVTREVDDGADCIANAPTATKSGWAFRGWREDTTASATVLPSKTCNREGIHLYAVFKQTITLSYNGNSATSGSTASQTGDRYYNNGNSTNVSFTLRANGYTRTNYTFAKWAQGSAGGTKYSAGATVSLSANTTFYAYWVATVTNYGYTGGMQSYTASVAGTYKLEVWGAQGGTGTTERSGGALGGYSYGNVALSINQTIYICVGGQGASPINGSTSAGGGYNGGGDGAYGQYGSGGGGGGATHIGKSNALLKNTSVSNLFIVAGGGGGAAKMNAPGTGGGTNGGDAEAVDNIDAPALGGTQSAGGTYDPYFGHTECYGSYGQGGVGAYYGDGQKGSGGGGGGYYGGAGGLEAYRDWWGPSGAGGSGYIGGVSGSKSTSNGQQSGNGYARVTFVSAS